MAYDIKKEIRIIMNCYLLLIILLCCGKNESGGCSRIKCERRREVSSVSCCHEVRKENTGCQTPPIMPRNQYPFLDSERESCSCEGNNN